MLIVHPEAGYDSSASGYLESDPIGLAGGSYSTYGYAGANPISSVDSLGLYDYSEQETLGWLQQAYDSSTSGRISGLLSIKKNSQGGGAYDFGYNKHIDDTWTRCGVKMDSDHFGNYMAGFQAAAYDDAFYWTTGFIWAEAINKTAGVLYHVTGRTKAVNDPWDHTGFPMINAGEKDGSTFAKNRNCGCSQ